MPVIIASIIITVASGDDSTSSQQDDDNKITDTVDEDVRPAEIDYDKHTEYYENGEIKSEAWYLNGEFIKSEPA